MKGLPRHRFGLRQSAFPIWLREQPRQALAALRQNRSMPIGRHPHHQGSGSGKAGDQDEEGDEQQMPPLIAREVRKQQFAGAFHEIFSHNLTGLFDYCII